jgi:hypothetical protein
MGIKSSLQWGHANSQSQACELSLTTKSLTASPSDWTRLLNASLCTDGLEYFVTMFLSNAKISASLSEKKSLVDELIMLVWTLLSQLV